MHSPETIKRFMSQTRRDPETGCLLWEGPRMYSKRAGGVKVRSYGTFRVGGRNDTPRTAHAVAWEITNGRPVPPGMVVRHLVCDTPGCVEGKHLSVGTYAENMADMMRKGRWESGKNRHRWITFNGATRTLSEWARLQGLGRPQVIHKRLKRGWDVGRALLTPKGTPKASENATAAQGAP